MTPDRLALKRAKEYYLTRETKGEKAVFGICNMDGEVVRRRYDGGELVEGDQEPNVLLSEKLEQILMPYDVKVIYGGRGSGKTRGVAALGTERIRFDDARILCMREIQNAISESSHQELADEIDRRKLKKQIAVTEKRIKSKVSKGMAWFVGLLRNLTNIKGKAGLTMGWCDEAENVSLLSWDTVIPTLRAEGSELFITFNPRFETDPTWTEFVEPYKDKMVDGVYSDPGNILVIECNWRDNPWFTEKLRRQMDQMRERDLDRYNWIWEGLFKKKSDEQVVGDKCVIEAFEPESNWDGPYFGADFGFSQDPATLVKMWISDEVLYIEHEAYKTGVELDDYADFYNQIPDADRYTIRADEARPDVISHIAKMGFNIEGAPKGPGSIEMGIAFIRSFKRIVIHERCRYTKAEASLYRHKVDKLTEEVLPDIIDKDNHIWDAVRYGLAPLINKETSIFDVWGK